MLRQGEVARRRLVTTLAGAALGLGLIGLIGASPAAAGAGPRIVGGSATTIGEWPWQVAIAADPESFGGNGFQRQFCGGTLVAPNVVLSAAHCFHDVFDNNGDFDDPDLFSVITGRTTLSSNVGQEIEVSNLFVAVDAGGTPLYEAAGDPTPSGPDLFDDFTFEWDAVFVTLAANSSSTPIKIAGPDETALWEADRDAVATGWGTTSSGGSKSDTLREVGIHMISDDFCNSEPPSYGTDDFFDELMVCAGETAGGRDTCQGDSGGPLVVPMAGGGFRLVGDTSFGFGCAAPNLPGVYGRIADDPMRTAIANAIQAETGANVLGSGGVPPEGTQPDGTIPPGVDPGAPAQPVTPVSPVGSDDCDEARDKLRAAKRKLRRAKSELKDAKRDDASEKTIDRAKNKVKKAKKKVRKAKQRVEEVC